ncbi:hypothetical protein FD737_13570 [Pantoea sp. Seng]|nr:hypothetical protein [Pantoea sp. Seng]
MKTYIINGSEVSRLSVAIQRALLWLLQSLIYLIPLAAVVAGIYIFVRFMPNYAAFLSISLVIVVSFIYIKYNRWY